MRCRNTLYRFVETKILFFYNRLVLGKIHRVYLIAEFFPRKTNSERATWNITQNQLKKVRSRRKLVATAAVLIAKKKRINDA